MPSQSGPEALATTAFTPRPPARCSLMKEITRSLSRPGAASQSKWRRSSSVKTAAGSSPARSTVTLLGAARKASFKIR